MNNKLQKKEVVLTAGTFDLLHPGHYDILNYAKKLGDKLIVVIARDKTVEKIKGRKPIIPENQRREMVEYIKPVDKAILGSLNNKLEPILKVKPDIIVLGPDQTTYKVDYLKKELINYLPNVKVVKFEKYTNCYFHSSYDIIKEILKRYNCENKINETNNINK